MRLFIFLTSRLFAIILLGVSIVALVVVNKYASLYHPVILVLPAALFLSVLLCSIRRLYSDAGRTHITWGSFIFHIGMLIIIVATPYGAMTRFIADVTLPEGLSVELNDEQFVSIVALPPSGEVPDIHMRLNSQQTIYEDKIYPVDYRAELTIGLFEDGAVRRAEELLRTNAPVEREGYQFTLIGGELSARFSVKDTSGKIVFSEFVNLSYSSDFEDTVEIPEAGLTLYTRFFPDLYMEGGKYGTRSPELRRPAYGIRAALKSDPFKDLWQGVLKEGERAEFAGMALEFTELRSVVNIKIVKDNSYWGILIGWLVILVGLLVRYFSLLTPWAKEDFED